MLGRSLKCCRRSLLLDSELSRKSLGTVAHVSRYATIRAFFSRSIPQAPSSQVRHTILPSWASHNASRHTTSLPISTSRYRSLSTNSSDSKPSDAKASSKVLEEPKDPTASTSQATSSTHGVNEDPAHFYKNYPRFLRRLATSLPNHPSLHRPTRDDFLNVANSVWDRFRIRFKWLTIRGFRKFNADDISAFFSWFLVGQTLWIFVGTTTFVSVVFAIANSLSMQATLARALSDYLTSETGIQIVFESAIVPRWKDSRISFQNVYVSRRPGTLKKLPMQTSEGHREAARLLTIGDHSLESYHDHTHEDNGKDSISDARRPHIEDPPDDVTYFDVNIDSVTVTLSLWRWWNGKGIITDAEVKGVRGVVDRRHLTAPTPPDLDPATTRHVAQPGDFQLESLQLEDILITIYQPNFRPFTASIFSADLHHFRKQWIFYDMISADNMVGQFDNCLFSVHRPQSINRTMVGDSKDSTWKRMSRFRIDGVNIDHIQYLTETDGPIAWISSGKVDSVVDIRFGRDPDEDVDIQALLGEIAANISAAATGTSSPGSIDNPDPAALAPPMQERIPGQRELARPALTAPSEDEPLYQDPSQVVIDIDLRFRDLKAAVPLFANDLSYTRNAFIRPIVAFINAHRTLVPIRCRIIKDLKEFDGSWTIWQTGLSDDVAVKTYEALAHHVANANQRRLKTVSLWSLRMTAGAISAALKNIVDSHSPKPYELA